MTNFEKTIIFLVSLLIIAVLAFGVISFRQQRAISDLKSKTGAGASVQETKQAPSQNASRDSIQSPKEKNSPSLEEVIKQFSGTIESVSGNQLMVSVKLTDFSKPKDPEKLKNISGPSNLKSDDFEVLEKKITVNTNEKTVFANKKFADLKAGDTVLVTSDKSPHTSDTVTAEKIIFFEPPK